MACDVEDGTPEALDEFAVEKLVGTVGAAQSEDDGFASLGPLRSHEYADEGVARLAVVLVHEVGDHAPLLDVRADIGEVARVFPVAVGPSLPGRALAYQAVITGVDDPECRGIGFAQADAAA